MRNTIVSLVPIIALLGTFSVGSYAEWRHAPAPMASAATRLPPEVCPSRLIGLGGDEIAAAVMEAASETGLSSHLIHAVILTESGYRPNAVSGVGAQGLMQLMPATSDWLGVANPFDARENIRAGSRYLGKLVKRFGSVKLALAAYNAGPSAVKKYGRVPPYRETRNYVRKVLRRLRESEAASR